MNDVAFSPDGRRVASSALDGRVYIWDAAAGRELRELDAHRDEAYAVAFSPDGERLATGGHDGTVRMWDASTGRREQTLEADPWPLDLEFAPDGDELLVGEADGDVVVHSLSGGPADTVARHRRGAVSVAWRPDGDALASADASVRVWDLESGAAVDTLTTRMPSAFMAPSPSGDRVAAGGAGRVVRLWSLTDPGGEGRLIARHDRSVAGVAFSPCGNRVASAGLDGRVRIALLEEASEDCPEEARRRPSSRRRTSPEDAREGPGRERSDRSDTTTTAGRRQR